MTVITTTLRPGMLIRLKVSTSGNVQYWREEIEADHVTEDGKRLAEWNTKRVIEDAEEHERADKVRSKARSMVRGVCIDSADFGLLCPDDRRERLTKAIAEARVLVEAFNADAKVTTVKFAVLMGRIATDDGEAVKAISGELDETIASIEEAISRLDVKAIRAAATRAKGLSAMLTPDVAQRVEDAVIAARATASEIVAAEGKSIEVDPDAIAVIAQARAVFLDLGDTVDVAAPVAQATQLDMGA